MTTTAPEIGADDRSWAIYAHAAGLLAFTNIPFASIIASAIIYAKVKGEDKPFAREHARSALNFQITWTLVLFAIVVSFFVAGISLSAHADEMSGMQAAPFIGSFATMVIGVIVLIVTNAVCSIVGCIRASSLQRYRYPFAIPFVR